MSISSQITRIKNAVASAYTSVGTMGGTLPTSKTVENLASAIESIPTGGGSSKNIQAYHGMASVKNASYVASGVGFTVAKTGTYKVSWMGARSTSSGTSGSQLYIGGSAYGSATTTFTNTYGQSVVLTNVSLVAGQTVEVRARSRSTSYYMMVGNLVIQEV